MYSRALWPNYRLYKWTNWPTTQHLGGWAAEVFASPPPHLLKLLLKYTGKHKHISQCFPQNIWNKHNRKASLPLAQSQVMVKAPQSTDVLCRFHGNWGRPNKDFPLAPKLKGELWRTKTKVSFTVALNQGSLVGSLLSIKGIYVSATQSCNWRLISISISRLVHFGGKRAKKTNLWTKNILHNM